MRDVAVGLEIQKSFKSWINNKCNLRLESFKFPILISFGDLVFTSCTFILKFVIQNVIWSRNRLAHAHIQIKEHNISKLFMRRIKWMFFGSFISFSRYIIWMYGFCIYGSKLSAVKINLYLLFKCWMYTYGPFHAMVYMITYYDLLLL